jgi:Pyruvate/2-oxoacid:ferredoxin oxidoreductase gamma subunit
MTSAMVLGMTTLKAGE